MTLKRISSVLVVMVLLAFLSACPVQAERIDIHFTGLNLVYAEDPADPGVYNIYDANPDMDDSGGNGDPGEADNLSTMVFDVNHHTQAVLFNNIFADVLIRDVPQLKEGGDIVTSTGNSNDFGFDLLTSLDGWGLALGITEFEVKYWATNITIAASGVVTSVREPQDLPDGIELDEGEEIRISASSSNVNVTVAGGYVTYFESAGTGTVTGTLVPEPSSFVLVGIALAGLLGFGWKKRRAAAPC